MPNKSALNSCSRVTQIRNSKLVCILAATLSGLLITPANAENSLAGCSYVNQSDEGNSYIDFHKSKNEIRISNDINPDESFCTFERSYESSLEVTDCNDLTVATGDRLNLVSSSGKHGCFVAIEVVPKRHDGQRLHFELEKSP